MDDERRAEPLASVRDIQAPFGTMKNGELIVDNFAGGGGASTGIEIATGVNRFWRKATGN